MDPYSGTQKALITLNHSLNFKIRDLKFVPLKNDEFMTVGIQHASRWKYSAGSFVFRELEIDTKEEKLANNLDEEEFDSSRLKRFLALCFLSQKTFVTSCDKGKLYLWKNNKIVQA